LLIAHEAFRPLLRQHTPGPNSPPHIWALVFAALTLIFSFTECGTHNLEITSVSRSRRSTPAALGTRPSARISVDLFAAEAQAPELESLVTGLHRPGEVLVQVA
jgi:hypothetical protein